MIVQLTVSSAGSVRAESDKPAERPFRTFFVTRSLAHERLLPFLESARPEIVQIGNYGAMFHGYADNPRSTRTPMMLPVVGERKALQFQRQLNDRVHALGLKVVGHFRLVKVMADREQQTGFVDYYNNRWPDDLLGPKPHPQLIELLQRDADGVPIQLSRYDNAQLALCLSSPHARQMLRQMLRCAVDHGVDGVITTYNYHQSCACPYCQNAFRKWLRRRFTPGELQAKLGIDQLDSHVFRSIPAQIPGYPDAAEAGELDWLAMRWGAEHFKRMFDDIFLKYGRTLRRDLLVAQWNHLSHVSLKEERMFLPGPLWGRGEDYFWYSGGATFVRRNLNLKERKAGDAWLSCLYTRELSSRGPFVMGKYDGIRLAVSMAEGYATGGLGMGRYMRFENSAGFDVLTRYTRFMHEQRELYDGAVPYSDVALVLPRQSVWNQRADALDVFRDVGQALVERQVLVDVVADERLTRERLRDYRAVILPGPAVLSDAQLRAIRSFSADGGLVLLWGDAGLMDETGRPRQEQLSRDAVSLRNGPVEAAADTVVQHLRRLGATRIRSPWTVRATAYQQPGRVVLHLVNYDRDESPDKQLQGPELERPRAARDIRVNLRLPSGRRVQSVNILTPDAGPSRPRFQQRPGRVEFIVPEILVYAVVSVQLN